MKTIKCPNCRKRTDLSLTACSHCGADFSEAKKQQSVFTKIRQIRHAYEANWLRDPNVVSVATRKDPDGVYYIAVGVEKLEKSVNISGAIDGVPVRIEQVGRIHTASV